MSEPRHAQNMVHDILDLLHRQRSVLQGFCESHPHLIIFNTDSGATGNCGGSIIGTKVLVSSFLLHPYSVGSRFGGFGSSACFHTQACRCARLTFSTNDSVVGGRVASLGAQAEDFPTLALQTFCLTSISPFHPL
jgi:hypothetical protein